MGMGRWDGITSLIKIVLFNNCKCTCIFKTRSIKPYFLLCRLQHTGEYSFTDDHGDKYCSLAVGVNFYLTHKFQLSTANNVILITNLSW